MRTGVAVLMVLISIGCTGLVSGMTKEDIIFENSHYVEAAKAARRGDVVQLDKLIKQGLDVNYEAKETKTPWGKDTVTLLLWATLSESEMGVEALLKAGADPNKATRRGMTPLMIASSRKSEAIFELLLMQYKADPNKIFGAPNETAFTIVLQERKGLADKRFDRAEKLIKYGADINMNIDRGDTATTIFSRLEDWRVVYWLLEHGANHEARDSVRATMMCSLRRSYRVNMLAPSEAYVYREKVREWLLARGVAPSRVDPILHPSPRCDD